MSKKNKGPGSYDMGRYFNAYYNPDSEDGRSLKGHIDRNVGEHLETAIMGRIVDNTTILQKTTGGIFTPEIFHYNEQSYPTPDICCKERNFLADVMRINLEDHLYDPNLAEIMKSKIAGCIKHTKSKINPDVLRTTGLKEPRQIAIGAFDFPDYIGPANCIDIIDNVMSDPSFSIKDNVDAIIFYFLPGGCDGNTMGGDILVYTSDTKLTEGLIKYDHVIKRK